MNGELDARFTFDTFVVGAANRLACAAARRVAESPGATYNPLFIYGASGLGKTHLVTAIGHHARRLHPELGIDYDTLEHFMDAVMGAIEAGERDAFRGRLDPEGMLILDDVQFLSGRHRTQEELLRSWDAISSRGGQVVLASDRPPHEIDGLDERLLSRFSGGLIVDMGVPDYETRVAILRRKAESREQPLKEGVAEAIARVAFANVRELQGALNRVLALQELETRQIEPDEVAGLLGREPAPARRPASIEDEFGAFLADISEAVGAAVSRSPAEQQLADAILRWEAEGYRTRRLEAALVEPLGAAEVEAAVLRYAADVDRLREVELEIRSLDAEAPELARQDVLRDPDRVDEAAALAERVRARSAPLPAPPDAPPLHALGLGPELLALRAASAVADAPGRRYNPLFVHGPAGSGKSRLLAALAHRIRAQHAALPVAFLEGATFATELIRALERNQVEGWKQRYRRARVLVLDGVDRLAGTERAQEELFHLFDALQRVGAQLVFSARTPPTRIDGMAERLRSRLASGLVVDLPEPTSPRAAGAAAGEERAGGIDRFFLSREKVAWEWPYPEDLLEELR